MLTLHGLSLRLAGRLGRWCVCGVAISAAVEVSRECGSQSTLRWYRGDRVQAWSGCGAVAEMRYRCKHNVHLCECVGASKKHS
jgi:hypothetical protein